MRSTVQSVVARARARPLVGVGLMVLMLLLLWMEITPPGSAPDENSHFVRLGGLAAGHPFGTRPAVLPDGYSALSPIQIDRVTREAGVFHLDSKYLYTLGGDCDSPQTTVRACAAPLPHAPTPTAVSVHARSQLAGYLAPAVFSWFGRSGRSTFYLARLGTVLLATLLVMGGIVSVRRAAPDIDIALLTAGTVAGITPLLASLGGVIAPGIIGAFGALGLCMCTWGIVKMAVVRVVDRVVWLAVLAAACLSESAGVAYAALAIVAGLVAAWSGPRRLIGRLRLSGLVASAVVVVGALVWDIAFKVRLPATESVRSASTWVHNLSVVWQMSLGAADHLGWLDVSMPAVVNLIWGGLFIWWIFSSLLFGDWRWAALLSGLACGFLAIGMVLAHSVAPTGFNTQTRYFLPGICIFPITAALRLSSLSRPSSISDLSDSVRLAKPPDLRRLLRPRLTLGLWGFGMTCALYAMLRRHVVSANGPIWYFGDGAFRPLGGWLLALITLIAFWIFVGLVMSTD